MVWAPEGSAARPVADGTTLEVLRALESGPRGLVEERAEERLARYGENTFPGRRPAPWPRRLARGLRDPFTAVLLCLGLVSAAVAGWGTACVIAVLVTVSCVLRATGEHRADRAAAGLRDLVAATATVRRRATETSPPTARELPVDQLVPGDVVLLAPGDLVPADLRLLRATGLTVHEAALTGESAPVTKTAAQAPAGGAGDIAATGPYDALTRPDLCLQGSGVVSGTGVGVVTATGAGTVLSGALPRGGAEQRRLPRPFERSVNGIAWTLVRFMLCTAPLVLVAGALLRGRGVETLPFAVAVAVGLTPEMLPVVVTTVLARGAALLARGGEAVVRRLPALHDLGAIDVLCVDKTGTLTRDRPVVACAVDADGRDDPAVLRWAAVNALWTLHLAELPAPDALDEAILDADEAAAEAPDDDTAGLDGVAALPYGPGRRLATAVVSRPGAGSYGNVRALDSARAPRGGHTLVVKGAPEDVLALCALADGDRARLVRRADGLAADGLRVLAVARAERPARSRPYTPADERDLTFVGFVGLRDALAPTAAEALTVLARRGVTVKVLTGDHPGTAARACRDLGLEPGEVVTGDRIDCLAEPELARLAARTTVFARCAPEHKARVVRALRAGGRTTGFLGDGVNDLAALGSADVGICPREGVDVAREAADVVLASKDLTALDRAIVAGRRSTGNIASYLRITLSSNLGNVIAMLVAGLLLPFLPMLPAQVLVQNLCFDAAQLALAFDRPEASAHRRPAVLRPRALLRFVTVFGLLNAVADLATFGVLALTVRGPAEEVFHAGWFTENLLTQALVILLLRPGRAVRRAPRAIRAAAAALAVVGVLLPLSPLGPALGMAVPPPLCSGLLAVVLGLYGAGLAAAARRHQPPPPKSLPPPPSPNPPPSPQPPPPEKSSELKSDPV
ncbi:magnesium-translocating P-type ATPase [Streptomyces sp. ISL-11]|uniref:magnesium-translocating P-type ATPase n=1 Tax=Streptomyces sp. ISL-11 TaxID=2819174 RepID=UPI001BE5EE94|nr:magnesium-translocating P-type ATPase [Streptomyces sp. ISL-11]MBT2384596.1 magnesium-translocating P-type ATPase [Streptomyces sp. ISL-11]